MGWIYMLKHSASKVIGIPSIIAGVILVTISCGAASRIEANGYPATAGGSHVADTTKDARFDGSLERYALGHAPGTGAVDVEFGDMMNVPAFVPQSGVEGIQPGKPVIVGHKENETLHGWVAWNDMYPTRVPVSPDVPIPMIPIVDADGMQIGWWAGALGWITFDSIRDPDFDYEALWEDEWSATVELNKRHGSKAAATPSESDG